MLLEATDCSRHTLVLEASTSIDFRYIDRISIGVCILFIFFDYFFDALR
ncbi:hypothetical protein IC582_007340 [Cucumis melo]